MVIPTLLVKGTLTTTSSKIKQESLDKFTAIHWILKLIEYKLSKKEPNIHDRLFMFQSLVGSGKTTAFIVEIFRYFFNTRKMDPRNQRNIATHSTSTSVYMIFLMMNTQSKTAKRV